MVRAHEPKQEERSLFSDIFSDLVHNCCILLGVLCWACVIGVSVVVRHSEKRMSNFGDSIPFLKVE